jgi:hypothetical protein
MFVGGEMPLTGRRAERVGAQRRQTEFSSDRNGPDADHVVGDKAQDAIVVGLACGI